MFHMFPFIVFGFTFVFSLGVPRLSQDMPLWDMLTGGYIGIFLYGTAVGSFAFMGREVAERQFGRKEYVSSLPALLPITYKKAVLGLYLRDLVFYIILIILPLGFGLAASIPFSGFSPFSVARLFVLFLLTFTMALSFSYLMSGLYVGYPKLFSMALLGIFTIFGAYFFGWLTLNDLLPAMGFHKSGEWLYLLKGLAFTGALLFLGYFSVRERLELKPRVQNARVGSNVFKEDSWLSRDPLLQKELSDLRRSRTLGKIMFSFVVPLLFLSFTSWFVRNGLDLPVGFNTVFYGGMVGFFGVLIYSWLNNMESLDYYQTLPVSVPQLIRTKVQAYLLVATGISSSFVIVIGISMGELRLLWLALIICFTVSTYMVTLTAYLTGLRPNSFLFDPDVLLKFTMLSLLPDVCITILSFSLDANFWIATFALLVVGGILAGAIAVLWRGIERKWGRAEFTP